MKNPKLRYLLASLLLISGVAGAQVLRVQNAAGVYTEIGPSYGLPVAGKTATAAVTITRPANTTAYAALDAISDSTSAPSVLTFSDVARYDGGGGYIVKARLITDQSTNTARYRLQLYTSAPTAINDNSPLTLLYANRATRVGYIDFPAATTEGTGSTAANSQSADVRLAFKTATATDNLYGVLEALDAFTPASAQNIYVELTAEQN